MNQLKIIHSNTLAQLEKRINQFIKDKQVKDIKYLKKDNLFLSFILTEVVSKN